MHPATYRQLWRWHLYAGLVLAPLILLFSITGGIYLYRQDIADLACPHLVFNHDRAPARISPESVRRAAVEAAPQARLRVLEFPTEPERAATGVMDAPDGRELHVFVDRASGEVLGIQDYRRTAVGLAERLHSSLGGGILGERIVELAACWTLILLVTGALLWWPRRLSALKRALLPDLNRRNRSLWRGLHGAIGAWTAFFIFFLIVSGLPWTGFWGQTLLLNAANAVGGGYPSSSPAEPAAHSDHPKGAGLPWAAGGAPTPRSDGHPAHAVGSR